mgnify:CR=1 FL=1
MKHDALFILGLPGSGKGTQARKLSEKLGYYYFEMGEVLRHIAEDNTPFGKSVKNSLTHGNLLSDEDIVEVIKLELRHLEVGSGIVFDGVPRRVGQGKFLLDYLKNILGKTNFGTVVINITKEECVKRIAFRSSTAHRADDNEEAVNRRVQEQSATLVEVLDLLKGSSAVYEIDGMPPIEEVERAISSALNISDAS